MKIAGKNVTVIGITGTIGAGKSTVGTILTEMGVPVIDTDKIVHSLLDNNEQVKQLIGESFAVAVKTDASGIRQIDRKQLAAIIFKDATAKKTLELILHPRVRQICNEQIAQLVSTDKISIIAVLVPLLFENQLQSQYDQVWTVTTEDKILRQRLKKRDGLSTEQINLRLAGQMAQEEKAKLADAVLDNSGNESQLREKVSHLIENLPATAREKSH